MRIRRGFRGRGAYAYTDGGAEGHGLPLMARVSEDTKTFRTARLTGLKTSRRMIAKASRFARRECWNLNSVRP